MSEDRPRQITLSHTSILFGLLFFSYLLLILYPILRADRDCNDDLLRAISGNYGWNNNGRHLTNLIMRGLQFGATRVVDISPLPQIIAIAVLAWTGVLVAKRYAIRSPIFAALATFPIGAQPFYLENLSYKFDAPCMALAMLFALLPIVVADQRRRNWPLGVLYLLASLNLYQPAISVFLIFSFLEVFVDQISGAPFAQQTGRLAGRMLQAAVACGLYAWLFGPSMKGWMNDHGAVIHSPDQLGTVAANAVNFYRFAIGSFDRRWVAFMALFSLVAAVPTCVSICRVVARHGDRPLWQTALLLTAAILLPFAALLSVAGPMLLLLQPLFVPRVMVGVGALLSAALIASHIGLRTSPLAQRIGWAVAGVWALSFAVAASASGNAAAAQRQYETHIAARLADDLAELRATHEPRHYLLDGSAGLAPAAAHAAAGFPLISTLVLPYLQENDFNSRNFLLQYLGGVDDIRANAHSSGDTALILSRAASATAVFTRSAYSLYLVDDTVVVRFSKPLASTLRNPSAFLAPISDIEAPQQIK